MHDDRRLAQGPGKAHIPFWSSEQLGPLWGSAGGGLPCRRGASLAAPRLSCSYKSRPERKAPIQKIPQFPPHPQEPIMPAPLSKEHRRMQVFLGLSVMGKDLLKDVISVLRHGPDSIYHLWVKQYQNLPFARRDCPQTSSGMPPWSSTRPLMSPTV